MACLFDTDCLLESGPPVEALLARSIPLHPRLPAAGPRPASPAGPPACPLPARLTAPQATNVFPGPHDKLFRGRAGPAWGLRSHTAEAGETRKQGSPQGRPWQRACRVGPTRGGPCVRQHWRRLEFAEPVHRIPRPLAVGLRRRARGGPRRGPLPTHAGSPASAMHARNAKELVPGPSRPPSLGGSWQPCPGARKIDLPPRWPFPQEVTVVSKSFNPTSGEVLMLLSTSDVAPARSYTPGDSGRPGRHCHRQRMGGQ